MARFEIVQGSPLNHKKEILTYWGKYLPGTSLDRLDWMEENPLGPPVWFFAKEKKTGKLSGTISIMPNDIIVNNLPCHAGIVGDFMVSSQYRVFGPTLDLIKAVTANSLKLGFDFLYTIPNPQSTKIAERAGFHDVGKLFYYVKPATLRPFIRKNIQLNLPDWLDKLSGKLMRLISRETYVTINEKFEEVACFDKRFDLFFQKIKNDGENCITSTHTSQHLNWRYINNPQFDFRILILREKKSDNILGYFVYYVKDAKLELYDMAFLNKKYFFVLLKKIMNICEEEKCNGLYCMSLEESPFIKLIRGCMFFDTKYDVKLYSYFSEKMSLDQWCFLSRDRNI